MASEPPSNCFERVVFHDCSGPTEPDGLYAYQRIGRDLLHAPGEKNLLVASPTGSGKTRIIENCVALALERGQRIFVAEPLIALVEQIYTRLSPSCGASICMVTGPSRKGDPDADVVVCTYEVLARIASSDPARLDGCPCVVLDEFHFLGTDRGAVLQEILAHCQSGRSVVALSGTMPNVLDLGAFLSRINGFPTHVIGAPRRPIDISFYNYACAGDRMSTLRPTLRPPPFDSRRVGGIFDRQALLRFLAQLGAWDCHPSLLVSFSCRRLDEMANWALGAVSIDRSARRDVAVGFTKLLKCVPAEDRELFSIYRNLADHGVAVHHSQCPAPYLELVSWLAERRALKLVFSSSTLSAGINLPVRTMCLLSARVPQKSGDGITHQDISPLLFHQLVGRAGRPGYESVGNCVILTKTQADYGCAQALMQCIVPPVLPQSGFSPGDVLRALRDRRSLQTEIQALACPIEHALGLRVARDLRCRDSALACTGPHAALVQKHVAAAVELLRAPRALLSFVQVPSEVALEIAFRQGGFVVGPPGAPGELVLPLTKGKRAAQRMPFEDAGAIFSLKEHCRCLLELLPDDEDLRRARDLCFVHAQNARALASSPLQEEFERAVAALGSAVHRDGEVALTALGAAACEVRTCPAPQRALEALLRGRMPDENSALAFASLSLQEGAAGDGDLAELQGSLHDARCVLRNEALAPLAAEFEGASPLWAAAVLCWAWGSPLCDLQELVPVGTFCRHVTRVADCCVELAAALRALGADGSLFEHASDRISHGLPFLKRGVWKTVEAAEAGEAGEAAEAGEAGEADARPLDMDAIFGDDMAVDPPMDV